MFARVPELQVGGAWGKPVAKPNTDLQPYSKRTPPPFTPLRPPVPLQACRGEAEGTDGPTGQSCLGNAPSRLLFGLDSLSLARPCIGPYSVHYSTPS